MIHTFNFSSGPACLPAPVLEIAAREMTNWRGIGYSVMEMSHREPAFLSIYHEAIDDLRELMDIPDDYEVLFLTSSASLQFSAVPLNLMAERQQADFIVTGDWSQKAFVEAGRYGTAHCVYSNEAEGYRCLPNADDLRFHPDAAYVHYCPNETIRGVEFDWIPETGDLPLVADLSSAILSKAIDVSRYGIIYAGAQKNIGPAGLTVVIIRKDLVREPLPVTPRLLNYQTLVEAHGLYNTPPTYSIYMAGLVFKWLKRLGGVKAIEAINAEKAKLLYDFIDRSALFYNSVVPNARSRMNVPFFLRNTALDDRFVQQAEERGLVQLRGHRTVGGMRASIYNAMPLEGVQALVEYMAAFELEYTD